MYKIGEFSILSKTTVKALRYYEKEKLLLPSYIDSDTNYRYYDASKLTELSKIISLRQIGLSIKDIKEVINSDNGIEIIKKRKQEIEDNLNLYNIELSKVNYLIKGGFMNTEVIIKELPEYSIYYKEGVIDTFDGITNFILKSAEECLKINPNIKCVEPEYCYISYLDGQYKDHDIKIRYAQAVKEKGIESDTIKFEDLKKVTAACIYHKGDYTLLGKSYGIIMKYIEDNGYEIIDCPRECYIDGIWNKEDVNDWLTEIQIPIRKK
ncbi:MAG TPA: MerR family transcriptional regulator [Bacilli bacterium]|nr:MerR family transcriptional regulator [Bacilli bacterium]